MAYEFRSEDDFGGQFSPSGDWTPVSHWVAGAVSINPPCQPHQVQLKKKRKKCGTCLPTLAPCRWGTAWWWNVTVFQITRLWLSTERNTCRGICLPSLSMLPRPNSFRKEILQTHMKPPRLQNFAHNQALHPAPVRGLKSTFCYLWQISQFSMAVPCYALQ